MALEGVSAGDMTDTLVFCDWLAERGQEPISVELRSAVAMALTEEQVESE